MGRRSVADWRLLLCSPQRNWLAEDLMRVDRSATPWVTVTFHNPW